MAAASSAAQMPFIKNLASSDRRLRSQSLAALETFLSARTSLADHEALRLWTGLFYALWMTDRPRPQLALAAQLAALPARLRADCVPPFLGAFWPVLSRQWAGVDALRVDKFLALARRVLGAHVRFAREQGWRGDGVARVAGVLAGSLDEGVAPGLRLHVLDVWVDEMEREGALLADGGGRAFAEAFAEAVRRAAEGSAVRSVRARARESLADGRLPWGKKEEEEDGGDEDEDEWSGIED
ncbi:uncharacterized protein UV8b_00064 [Ustilaginoidea virens]|uniref:Nucleolar protein NOP52 variant n=1 Tax=Ustilaginoidea virens TaxID=1159556 RepID=A0A1B5L810_USTVR|nr:uncharacterized protein UV8b_00064 [Ustilaginoidea virens]QUC15823.1 hypothetical protein UV8b_00064 [Ustilaginoidea virens]GAO19836.1 hypothetical protein UVI_02052900 [Ustilaginoidea virens]